MYKRKIVCALKHGNTPLNEDKDKVYVPINSEYSIYLKNMSELNAYIKVYVNGRDVSPFKRIYLLPKASATITQFEDTKHSFSYREKTQELQQVRNNLDDDSLILIKVELEEKETKRNILPDDIQINANKLNTLITKKSNFQSHSISLNSAKVEIDRELTNPNNFINEAQNVFYKNEVYDSSYQNEASNFKDRIKNSAKKAFSNCSLEETKTNNLGFTAPGKKKTLVDTLTYVYDEPKYVEERFQIILYLEPSEEIVYSKDIKKTCPTCNKKFKSKYFYCPFDGTFLE